MAVGTVALLLLLPQIPWTSGQNFEFLPMGLFRWASPITNSEQNGPSTASTFLSIIQSVGRPQVDTAIPPGVDSAAVAAKEAAIISFINSCPRQTGLAWLRCPCSQHGDRCADPLSLCNLENRCICNGRLGYEDRTGTKCVAYATTPSATTARSHTSTLRTTTSPSSPTTSLTSPTTSTTLTTRTSTTTTSTSTTTTTPDLTTRISVETCPVTPASTTLSDSDRIELQSQNYPGTTSVPVACGNAATKFRPPLDKKLKVDFIDFLLESSANGNGDCANPNVEVDAPGFYELYCTMVNPPPPTVTFGTNEEVIFYWGITVAGSPYKFRIRITVV